MSQGKSGSAWSAAAVTAFLVLSTAAAVPAQPRASTKPEIGGDSFIMKPVPRPSVPEAQSEEREPQVERTPPESGEASTFSYRISTDYAGVYEITPFEEEEPFLVSDTFLGLILNNRHLDDEQRLAILSSYEEMTLSQYGRILEASYPAGSSVEMPFDARTITGESGASAALEEDGLAAPYLRVLLTTAEGEYLEFSMARSLVEKLLANPYLTNDGKIDALRMFQWRLSERARAAFRSLAPGELHAMIAEEPHLQRQEIVRMIRIFSENPRTGEVQGKEAAEASAKRGEGERGGGVRKESGRRIAPGPSPSSFPAEEEQPAVGSSGIRSGPEGKEGRGRNPTVWAGLLILVASGLILVRRRRAPP